MPAIEKLAAFAVYQNLKKGTSKSAKRRQRASVNATKSGVLSGKIKKKKGKKSITLNEPLEDYIKTEVEVNQNKSCTFITTEHEPVKKISDPSVSSEMIVLPKLKTKKLKINGNSTQRIDKKQGELKIKRGLESIKTSGTTKKLKKDSSPKTLDSKMVYIKDHKVSLALEKKPQNKNKIKKGSKKAEKTSPVVLTEPSSSTSVNENDEVRKSWELMLGSMDKHHFFEKYWEKGAHYIKRNSQTRFAHLVSTPGIDRMLRNNVVMFGKHLDVTSYESGVRETHNLEGRAHAHVVWDYYSNGCSVRLLNPQAFFPEVHKLNASLQEIFGSFVGSNLYLTPPDSQGFAPHFDDIEAFILQIEGKKKWKVYKPRSEAETLPRHSSRNLEQSELPTPELEVELNPGDVLYFPRGFIHQASTVSGSHSLHLTVSVYQKTSWADLLEKELPAALKRACSSDLSFRRGLPLGYLKQAGFGYPAGTGHQAFTKTLQKLVQRVAQFVNPDEAADFMGTSFIHDALPPFLSPEEKKRMVLGGGSRMSQDGSLSAADCIKEESRIRLIRDTAVRLVEEEAEEEGGVVKRARLYYAGDNSLEYHAEDKQFVDVPEEMVQVVRFLLSTYPTFVAVSELPAPDDDGALQLASDLWERGILILEKDPVPESPLQDSSESLNSSI